MLDTEIVIKTLNHIRNDIVRDYDTDDGTLEYKQLQMIRKGIDDIIRDFETIDDIKQRVLKNNNMEFWRQSQLK